MSRFSPPQFRPVSPPGFDAGSTQHRFETGPDALRPGTRIAEYEILAVLGQGESGIVYLSVDHGLQRQVAMKEYLPAALASRGVGAAVAPRCDANAEAFARGLASFVDEARLLARFDHPALVRVYRFWEANGTAYVVMPYYEGIALGVARQSTAHPPTEAWLRDLLLPLLGALDALHGASCYPRDISPENILLLPDDRPVLLDAGAARQVSDERNRAHTVIFKPAFTPIEQYSESPNLPRGPWSSLYSLAAVAYYCISGHAPVASAIRALDDPMEPLSQVVDRLGRSFPELDYSVAFVSAIERALNVRPEERPRSVAEFRRALLRGQCAAESAGMAPAAADTEPQVAPPALTSSIDDAGPSPTRLAGSDGGSGDQASRGASKPSQPRAAPRAEPSPQTTQEAQTRFVSPSLRTTRGPIDDADDASRLPPGRPAPGRNRTASTAPCHCATARTLAAGAGSCSWAPLR